MRNKKEESGQTAAAVAGGGMGGGGGGGALWLHEIQECLSAMQTLQAEERMHGSQWVVDDERDDRASEMQEEGRPDGSE